MPKGIIRICVANFHAKWGDKHANLKKMAEYIEEASDADIIVFPEAALTGYDNIPECPQFEKMQVMEAESIPGPTIEKILALAGKHSITVVFGMFECVPGKPGSVYNSAAIVRPSGEVFSYRKIHLPDDEGSWVTPGDRPMAFDTEWGPIGVSLCYDTYTFPELIRYARAKGARLHLNCTACFSELSDDVPFRLLLEEKALSNQIYIATAGLCGAGRHLYYIGGSSVIGTSRDNKKAVKYFAGLPFGSNAGNKEMLYSTELDLDAIDKNFKNPMFERNPYTGKPDFAPDIYARAYAELAASEEWKCKIYV
jgi:predicted amidohydrolase